MRGSNEDSDQAILPAAEAVRVPAHLAPPGSPQSSGCATFTLSSPWGSAATGRKVMPLCKQGLFGHVQFFVTLLTVACQASLSGRGFSRQEDWGILSNAGCHTLLEHCISRCPSRRQAPEDVVLPETLRPSSCTTSTPGPHRGRPKPPGQPQEQTPVDDPHAEVGIKPQLKPKGCVAEEEDPKPSHWLYRPQIKSA